MTVPIPTTRPAADTSSPVRSTRSPTRDCRSSGRSAIDAGASTGGFTDVLLRRGAARVVAVDVGYGQLAWSLRQDERVTVLDRTNVRDLTPDAVGGAADVAVADLSFISLTTVLPALAGVVDPAGDLVLMVKPQFEVGRERLGKGGVVRDPELRVEAVLTVAARAWSLGLGVQRCVREFAAGSGRQYRSTSSGCVEVLQRSIHKWSAAWFSTVRNERVDGVTDETPGDDRRVLLVVHTGRTEAIEVACAVANRLAAAGVRVRVLDTDAPSLEIAAAEVVPADGQAAIGCEMALVIGGDGTILRGAELTPTRGHAAARHQPRPRRVHGRG